MIIFFSNTEIQGYGIKMCCIKIYKHNKKYVVSRVLNMTAYTNIKIKNKTIKNSSNQYELTKYTK